ncbi:MAG: endo-1,4-beta-xylanase [Lachnospiraceae bacterium]|nr:endo-1,4-beta-xylanase [Lachnospiraceae bacterium]
MKQVKNVRALLAGILVPVLFMTMVLSYFEMPQAQAAAKPKFSTKKMTVQLGKTKKLSVKKAKGAKLSWKVKNKKVVSLLKAGKYAKKVKGKKAGTTKITCKVTYRGKKYTLKCTVKVIKKKKPTPTDTPVPSILPTPDNGTNVNPPKDNNQQGGTGVNPTETPTNPTEKPTTPTEKPTTPTEKPVTPTEKPASPTEKPISPTEKPATPTEKPVTPTEKPTTPENPVLPTAEPGYTPEPLKVTGFENGTDGFSGRGPATVSSEANGYKGNCLKVSGRTANWNGAGFEAKDEVVANATYTMTAYVRLKEGSGTVKCTYETKTAAGADSIYTEIASVPAGTEWTQISGSFTVPDSYTMFYLYFEVPDSATVDFYIDEVAFTQVTKGTQIDSIKDAYSDMFGMIGTCLTSNQTSDAATMKYVQKHYNSMTMENEMKPDSILGTWNKKIIQTSTAKSNTEDYVVPSSYTETTIPSLHYDTMDAMLKIAYDSGVKVRAHTLVWHSQTPDWFFKVGYDDNGDFVSTSVMDARMEMYIRSVMHHVYTIENGKYKDTVYVWDVANEYLNNSKDDRWSAVYGNREKSDDETSAANKNILGSKPPYVKKAFEIAYDVLKEMKLTNSVKLFYNDFNTYYNSDKVVELINYINEGEPEKICDGIGMQSHLDYDGPSVEFYSNTLQKFADAGFEIQITELDVTINNYYGNYKEEGQTDEQQAEYFGNLMKAIIAKKKAGANITCLTLWGLYDEVSWRGGPQSGGNSHPLLFNTGLNDAKPSYYAFMNAIKEG